MEGLQRAAADRARVGRDARVRAGSSLAARHDLVRELDPRRGGPARRGRARRRRAAARPVPRLGRPGRAGTSSVAPRTGSPASTSPTGRRSDGRTDRVLPGRGRLAHEGARRRARALRAGTGTSTWRSSPSPTASGASPSTRPPAAPTPPSAHWPRGLTQPRRTLARVRPDLPTGTVTFLFTDVEGSTRLLHALGPDAYAKALAEHRRVLRVAFAAHGGIEVDTQGDSFFVAFPTATGAASAALTGQDALLEGADPCPHRPAHRHADRHRRRLRRHRRAPRRSDRARSRTAARRSSRMRPRACSTHRGSATSGAIG